MSKVSEVAAQGTPRDMVFTSFNSVFLNEAPSRWECEPLKDVAVRSSETETKRRE